MIAASPGLRCPTGRRARSCIARRRSRRRWTGSPRPSSMMPRGGWRCRDRGHRQAHRVQPDAGASPGFGNRGAAPRARRLVQQWHPDQRKMTTIMRAGWSPAMKRSPPKTAGGVRGAAEPALGRGACDRDLSPDPGRRGAGTPCIRRTAPECHRGGMKAGLPLQLRRIASRTACTALSLRLSGSIHAVIDRRYAVYALFIRRLTMRLQL